MANTKNNPFYINRVKEIPLLDFLDDMPRKMKVYGNSGSRDKRALRFMRWPVYERDDYTCILCGLIGFKVVVWRDAASHRSLHYDLSAIGNGIDVMITLDHRLPRALGGKTVFENLDTMCTNCNNKKGAKHPKLVLGERWQLSRSV